jgi:uncharacterized membrane protein YecN with MAPEG domain
MIILPITLTAAGSAALINLWLAIRCGQVRAKYKINMGDGGNEMLIAAMRAQSNHVEFTPFVLILLGLVELAIGSPVWLWIVSGAYQLARVLHGLGMMGTLKSGRAIGVLVSMLVTLGLAGLAIAIPYLTPQAAQMHQVRLG